MKNELSEVTELMEDVLDLDAFGVMSPGRLEDCNVKRLKL